MAHSPTRRNFQSISSFGSVSLARKNFDSLSSSFIMARASSSLSCLDSSTSTSSLNIPRNTVEHNQVQLFNRVGSVLEAQVEGRLILVSYATPKTVLTAGPAKSEVSPSDLVQAEIKLAEAQVEVERLRGELSSNWGI